MTLQKLALLIASVVPIVPVCAQQIGTNVVQGKRYHVHAKRQGAVSYGNSCSQRQGW